MHKNKSYIYFMLESSWIVDLIFSKFKTLKTYDKTYEITRRKTIHKIFVINDDFDSVDFEVKFHHEYK